MASPVNAISLDEEAADNVDGEPVRMLGHFHASLFVNEEQDGSFEVRLEGSPNGENWGVVQNNAGEDIVISHNELNEDGNALRHVAVAAEYVRARLNENSGGVVTAYIMASGNVGQGRRGTARQGAVQRE